ncbi:hypothetical protein GGI42DRAFT_88727 [Trichoderma sp. SZMC 28013]
MKQAVVREPAQCRGGIRAGIKSTMRTRVRVRRTMFLCKGEEASSRDGLERRASPK